jgi:hypothetical protein
MFYRKVLHLLPKNMLCTNTNAFFPLIKQSGHESKTFKIITNMTAVAAVNAMIAAFNTVALANSPLNPHGVLV